MTITTSPGTRSQPGRPPGPPTGRARRDRGVRLAAGCSLWGSLLLVTYWWAADRGLQDLTGWADALTSLGRLSGLVASVLLLTQVFLMARVPVLEAAFGQDRLARVHRWVGFCSFDLMLAHIVTITWGYAGGELTQTPATGWNLLVEEPGVLLAGAGTLALVAVVVTSVRAARRRLRYESWHLIHLYAYLGVGLALPHQLWTGQEFTGHPLRTVFWWAVWGATMVAVLVHRVTVPLVRSLRLDLRVTSVVQEAPDVVSVVMTGRNLHRLGVEAGQFLGFRFLDGPGWMRNHPYSLSAAPDGRRLRITVRTTGDGGRRLRNLRPGTRVLVEGSHGRLSARARTRRDVVLIGAGVGITPLRALAEGLGYAPGEAVLLHRHQGRPLFAREFDVLARDRGLRVVDLPGPRRAEGSWLPAGTPPIDDVTALRHLVPDIAGRDVYVCGPAGWTADVRRAATAAGVPAERFHCEDFGW
ncbi:ferric reductase-like transmembrane domain-containing protein [Kineococcus sp. R86509]|uniref:ferredoxin reductase family protein n=1 Tax=Kineococcus sp. R86509 TaxID=3093851 RepID=UPI0036D2BEE1